MERRESTGRPVDCAIHPEEPSPHPGSLTWAGTGRKRKQKEAECPEGRCRQSHLHQRPEFAFTTAAQRRHEHERIRQRIDGCRPRHNRQRVLPGVEALGGVRRRAKQNRHLVHCQPGKKPEHIAEARSEKVQEASPPQAAAKRPACPSCRSVSSCHGAHSRARWPCSPARRRG